jgi:hypothetical protein
MASVDRRKYLCVDAYESFAWFAFVWSYFSCRTKAVVEDALNDPCPDVSNIL